MYTSLFPRHIDQDDDGRSMTQWSAGDLNDAQPPREGWSWSALYRSRWALLVWASFGHIKALS